jgi:hypothetical protein
MTKRLKIGDAIPLSVTRSVIDCSEPCCKEDCMVSEASKVALRQKFGEHQQYYLSSTTNGVKFTIDGWRYTAAFPPSTAKKIFNYDQVFKQTGNAFLARKSVDPFRTKLVVIDAAKIAPPLTPEQRKRQNEYQNRKSAERRAKGLKARKYSGQREISL